jgi:hypothetical protein
MTDALDPNLRAEVAAEFECTGLDGCMYDDHDWKCFVQKRPAVEALIAKVGAGAAAYREAIVVLNADRDTLRRELAEARAALARIEKMVVDAGYYTNTPEEQIVWICRALTPKGATDGEEGT